MIKRKAGLQSQELERIMNRCYNTFTTKTEQCRRAFSIITHEPEIGQYFLPLTGSLRVRLRKRTSKVLLEFEVNSKSFEISPSWHMNTELRPFRSAY